MLQCFYVMRFAMLMKTIVDIPTQTVKEIEVRIQCNFIAMLLTTAKNLELTSWLYVYMKIQQ